ncbi:hypothetical protein E2C01_101938 [Portunus trituberculatus]|uniref:Uncharacterized protein n=1 Tax=Portunus trituberculatus TaxID=210409 RepID=A0A5B7KH90_PORTR|nr:hypothetical protein [Portunus trituberculatus]
MPSKRGKTTSFRHLVQTWPPVDPRPRPRPPAHQCLPIYCRPAHLLHNR